MRSYVDEVLKEEVKRLGEAVNSYLREIRELPKGSVQKKKIGGHVYPYLVVRDGSRVRYRYLGKLSGEKLEDLNKGIEARRRYQRLLREVRRNRDRIERMLHGKRRAV